MLNGHSVPELPMGLAASLIVGATPPPLSSHAFFSFSTGVALESMFSTILAHKSSLQHLSPREPDLWQEGLPLAVSSTSVEWHGRLGAYCSGCKLSLFSSAITAVLLPHLCVISLNLLGSFPQTKFLGGVGEGWLLDCLGGNQGNWISLMLTFIQCYLPFLS